MADGQLFISFQDVRDLGRRIESAGQDLASQMNDLVAKSQPDGMWSGFSADAYVQYLTQWKTNADALTAALAQVGPMLVQFADAMQEGDSQFAAKILNGG